MEFEVLRDDMLAVIEAVSGCTRREALLVLEDLSADGWMYGNWLIRNLHDLDSYARWVVKSQTSTDARLQAAIYREACLQLEDWKSLGSPDDVIETVLNCFTLRLKHSTQGTWRLLYIPESAGGPVVADDKSFRRCSRAIFGLIEAELRGEIRLKGSEQLFAPLLEQRGADQLIETALEKRK